MEDTRRDSHWFRFGAAAVFSFLFSFVVRRLLISFGFRRLAVGLGVAAAATIATLTLTGTVGLVLEITVSPTPSATNLDLSTDLPRTRVADLTVLTNSPSGYLVTVRSENVFVGSCVTPCIYSPSTNQALSFRLYRGTTEVGFSGSSALYVQTFIKSVPGGDPYEVGISYTGSGANLSPANNYAEVLTFSVAVN